MSIAWMLVALLFSAAANAAAAVADTIAAAATSATVAAASAALSTNATAAGTRPTGTYLPGRSCMVATWLWYGSLWRVEALGGGVGGHHCVRLTSK